MYKLLIDLDGFVYRAAFAAQKTHYICTSDDGAFDGTKTFIGATALNEWCNENGIDRSELSCRSEVVAEDVSHALHVAKLLVTSAMEELKMEGEGTEAFLFLSGDSNFRNSIYPEYKANRTQPKPVHYQAVRDYYVQYMGAEVVDGIEADDAISIAATECSRNGDNFIIVTQDKDLSTVAGDHYDWVKKTLFTIDEDEALKLFYCQLLTGDPTDNIPGVYGLGPKKAEKIIADCTTELDMYNAVLAKYKEAYGEDAKDIIVRNGRLLHMLRHRGELWQPPK